MIVQVAESPWPKVIDTTNTATGFDIAVTRHSVDGTLDTTWGGTGSIETDFGAGAAEIGYALAIQPDDKVVVAGFADGAVGVARYSVASLRPDPDLDDDGILNGDDNCPEVANADQADLDLDDAGDACDVDDDGDGVSDTGDNCPTVANADQSNIDGDAFGDVCDTDDDGDGLSDGADACPAVAEDADANQDTDGCPEDASHDLAVATFRVPGGSAGGSARTIAIKIKNLGAHADTAFVEVTGSASYAGCSLVTPSIAPGATLTVRGCTVSYLVGGSHSHTVTVYHASSSPSDPAQYSDNDLSDNGRTTTTKARS